MTAWDAEVAVDPGPGWVLLEESGWDALIAWAAGAQNLRRAIQHDDDRWVSISGESTDKTRSAPFTIEDRSAVEAAINGYLADAEVPPRPAGFDWYLRSLVSDAGYLVTLNRALVQRVGDATHPRRIRDLIEAFISEQYGR